MLPVLPGRDPAGGSPHAVIPSTSLGLSMNPSGAISRGAGDCFVGLRPSRNDEKDHVLGCAWCPDSLMSWLLVS
jgi:hypothetical protein